MSYGVRLYPRRRVVEPPDRRQAWWTLLGPESSVVDLYLDLECGHTVHRRYPRNRQPKWVYCEGCGVV